MILRLRSEGFFVGDLKFVEGLKTSDCGDELKIFTT